MQHYISKVVEIEASQWDGTPEDATRIIDWVLEHGGTAIYSCPWVDIHEYCKPEDHVIKIHTLEGSMDAGKGWWIIKDTEGEFYPCKDSVFRAKYELEFEEHARHIGTSFLMASRNEDGTITYRALDPFRDSVHVTFGSKEN